MRKTAWQKATSDAGIPATQATNYLNTLPTLDQHAINNAKRKDNPAIIPHIANLKATHQPKPRRTYKTRRSLGNPARTPRAGAPNLNGTFNIESLVALKAYALDHGGLDQIQHDLDALRAITTA